ncbi:hypothetical protein ACLOJK_030373 [Asimina triloba]
MSNVLVFSALLNAIKAYCWKNEITAASSSTLLPYIYTGVSEQWGLANDERVHYTNKRQRLEQTEGVSRQKDEGGTRSTSSHTHCASTASCHCDPQPTLPLPPMRTVVARSIAEEDKLQGGDD